jgi:hypothetical protein
MIAIRISKNGGLSKILSLGGKESWFFANSAAALLLVA